MSECKFCGSTILWKMNTNGRRMPIDWQETPDLGYNENEIYDPSRMVSHFLTCPNIRKYRKGDKRNANSK